MGWSEMSRSVASRFSNLGREQRSVFHVLSPFSNLPMCALEARSSSLLASRGTRLFSSEAQSAESEEKVEKKDHGSSKAVLPPKGRGKKWVAQLHVQAFDPQVNEFACNYIRHLAGLCGVRTGNIVRLPTRKELITILRSPHVDKKAREQLGRHKTKRLICVYDTAPDVRQVFYKTLDERPPVGVMITIRDKEGISAPPPSQ